MNKIPLVLIPGLLSDATVFQSLKKELSDIADISIPEFSRRMNLEEILNSILADAPQKFILGGHSRGGWLALEIIKRHPQRVLGLILMTTSAAVDSPEKLMKRQKAIERFQRGDIDALIDEIVDAFTYNDNAKAAVRQMFYHNTDGFENFEKITAERDSNLDLLATITQPTLVIAAKKDREFYQSTRQIAEAIPNATLMEIGHCGHMLTMEQPQKVNAIVRQWLQQFY